ncbi:hypothetical protein GGR26_002883 [Lewinella marina]|uniref:Cupin 2 conserved barrel domain-containing protein n=1 Tax=Neolewinella marina TaxID=438751 RepID=A0A2G0CBM9_9BACT|nr:hypothetical protein [Neolewinella marina]NJB87106.1 hypothetical protein [Neolewinella marina]PHK97365.1 hypothetical protein CGL56_16295 [Neolewinella marina]
MNYSVVLPGGIAGLFLTLAVCVSSCQDATEIVVQDLQMEIPADSRTFSETVLPGEIADTRIEHLAYAGPASPVIDLEAGHVTMFIFLAGTGVLHADTFVRHLTPESIAIPMDDIGSVRLEVPAGEELHFLQFTKKLTDEDNEDLASFPADNKYSLYFTRFVDTEPYTEKIKSPNTVSRTVLPADIIPRVSLGTVEAPGPDRVGAHEHPMLDQLFLGLTDNDIVVHADNASAELGEFSVLHIPIGSSHSVTVGENKKMYYLWMDFFLNREGQEWLKTHKPVSTDETAVQDKDPT